MGALSSSGFASYPHKVLVAKTAFLDYESFLADEDRTLECYPGVEDPGFEEVENREALDGIVKAVKEWIRQQSKLQQAVLHMKFCLGLSQVEIARQRGVTEAAVSKQLAKIYQRGRVELTQVWETYMAI